MLPESITDRLPSRPTDNRGQLGVFMVLVMGAIALVVVSIVLLFGIDLAGSFAEPMTSNEEHTYYDQAESTANSTGDAFELFGTSVLVIPAAAVLAVLIGGLVGAIASGGNMRGVPQNGNGGGPRR